MSVCDGRGGWRGGGGGVRKGEEGGRDMHACMHTHMNVSACSVSSAVHKSIDI